MARALIGITLFATAIYAGILSDESLRPLVQQTIAMRFEQRYSEADSIIESLRTAYPNDPAPLFLKGSNLHDDMTNREDYRDADRVDAIFDTAIGMAIADTSDPWNIWIIGSSLGYKAMTDIEFGRYFSAYGTSRRALGFLKIALSKPETHFDAALGTGGYYFWASSALGFLTYLPLVPDNRDEGLEYLREARDSSLYSRDAAAHALVYVFCKMGQTDSARAMRDIISKKYPSSILPLWYNLSIAEADDNSTEYLAAAERLCAALDTLGSGQAANLVEIHYYAAIAAKNLSRWDTASYHCNKILESELPPWVREKYADEIEDAEGILREAIERKTDER